MCEAWKDTTIGHRGDEYMNMKRRMAQECIQLAETVIPGLGEMVTRQYTSTPLTYRDYTLTPEGSAYGVRKDCRSVMLTMLSPQSPIPNLLFTGQNMMLHGLEGVAMTAMNTTRLLLK
jgi:all-trans-retinol 13,14-reductase